MTLRRTLLVVGLFVYIFLWVLALHGAHQFIGPLTVPVILGVLIAAGVALDRWMGISHRSPRFDDGQDDASSGD